MTTVLIYVDTSKEVGDPEHVKVFADEDTAHEWFADQKALRLPIGFDKKARHRTY